MKRYIWRFLTPILVLILSTTGVVGGPGIARADPDCSGSSVSIGDWVMWEGTEGGTAPVPVTALVPCAHAMVLTYGTFDITAKAGEDYVGVDSGQVVLPARAKSTVIRIHIIRDTAVEPPERFGVRLLDGAVFADPEGIVTILDR